MRNFKPKNMDSLKILHPKIWILHISYPKILAKLCFSHKFDGKRLFLRYYIIESSKNDSCLNFLPPKIEKFILQILDRKRLSSEVSYPKHGTHTPVCKHGKYPPPGFQQRGWIWNSPVQRPTNTAL